MPLLHQEEWDTEEVLSFVYDVRSWRNLDDAERVEWCRRVRYLRDNVTTDEKSWTVLRLARMLGISQSALSDRFAWSERVSAGDPGGPMTPGPRSPGKQIGDVRRAFRNPDIESVVKADLVSDALSDPEVAAAVAKRISMEPDLVRLLGQGAALNTKRREHHPSSEQEEQALNLDAAWQAWLGRINAVLMVGVRLAQESGDGSGLNAHSELAFYIYQQITERKLDAEIRELFESYEVTS